MSEILTFLDIAKQASLEAGKIHMEFFEKDNEVSYKLNQFDLVTKVDKLSEEKIETIILNNFPEHSILGEEGGIKGNRQSDYLWIVDPLDGTTNYTHRFPQFAVSIALYYKNQPYLGVIYDSFKKEMFSAAKNKGAFLNDKKIQVSDRDNLEKSLLATGFPCSRENILEENLAYFKEFLYKCQAVRRPGAASLDLAYVACGRLDGFWELNLSPWDVAAGVCIIEEAGGTVSNIGSKDFDYNTKNIIATNGKIHKNIDDVILEVRKNLL